MRPHEAYKQQQNTAMPRVDLILALYRKALEFLQRARQALVENRQADAQPLLGKVQLIVSSLAAGQVGGSDPLTTNFLQLYEFVSHQMTLGSVENIDAAEKVMRTLCEAFVEVRDQAAVLEAQGQIPPLERSHLVQLTA